MAELVRKKTSALPLLAAGSITGKEFFSVGYQGSNYRVLLEELKTYIGVSGGGGGSVDLTSVLSDVVPFADNSYTLGADGNHWKRVYVNDIDSDCDLTLSPGGNVLIPGSDLEVGGSIYMDGQLLSTRAYVDGMLSGKASADALSSLVGRVTTIEEDYLQSSHYDKLVELINGKVGMGEIQGNYLSLRDGGIVSGDVDFRGELTIAGYIIGGSSSGLTLKTNGENALVYNILTDAVKYALKSDIPTTTDQIGEGNNLYFTNQRALDATNGTYLPIDGIAKGAETAGTAASAGYANSAGQATNDSAGNKIVDTYLKISDYNTSIEDLATESWVSQQGYAVASLMGVLNITNAAGNTATFKPYSNGPTSLTINKSFVGLSNVENTALSTWAGSANITTLGTITSGIWNGAKIDQSHLDLSGYVKDGASINSLGITSINTTTIRTQGDYIRQSGSSEVWKLSTYGSGNNPIFSKPLYVQDGTSYNLLATQSWANSNFHPLTTVDTAPTISSSNLVTSGGVAKAVADLAESADGLYQRKGSYLTSSSTLASANLDNNTITIAGTSVSLGGSITQNQLIANLGLKGLAFEDSIDLSGYQEKITSTHKLDYGLISGTPTLATVATSGSYNDLSNKPTIPSAITESTVSGWGFTKNAGTITGIKMNKVSIGTSGVVDLGTVLTSHQTIHSLTIKNSDESYSLTYTPNSSSLSITLGKSWVGLGNVENTKLSTWAGSANITTLGTITSGTWKGSKITNAYLDKSTITVAGQEIPLGGVAPAENLKEPLGITALSSTVDNHGTIIDDLDARFSDYLPKAGGIIDGTLYVDGAGASIELKEGAIKSNLSGIDSWSIDDSGNGVFKSLKVGSSSVIHTGNISSYALAKDSNGTVSLDGNIDIFNADSSIIIKDGAITSSTYGKIKWSIDNEGDGVLKSLTVAEKIEPSEYMGASIGAENKPFRRIYAYRICEDGKFLEDKYVQRDGTVLKSQVMVSYHGKWVLTHNIDIDAILAYSPLYDAQQKDKIVPIKHPDLSTQPSILSQKFAGEYVYEQMRYVRGQGRDYVETIVEDSFYDKALIVDVTVACESNFGTVVDKDVTVYSYNRTIVAHNFDAGFNYWVRVVWTDNPVKKKNNYYYGGY